MDYNDINFKLTLNYLGMWFLSHTYVIKIVPIYGCWIIYCCFMLFENVFSLNTTIQ